MREKEEEKIEKKADFLFEVSWEVCNKVGGIFTVVKSKAARIKDYYDGKYFLVGPYFLNKAAGQFEEEMPQDNLKEVFETLKKEGIECHFGKWLIEGEPYVILVDFSNFAARKDSIKTEFWKTYKIDSLNTQYFDYDEPIVWSYAVGRLIHEFSKTTKEKIVAQVHEWLAAGGLLYLKQNKAKVATVFTTHATILGRTIASSGRDLYSVMDKIDPEKEAFGFGIQAKYLTERAAAQNSDAFTTVSEITGMEAAYLLKKSPDVILPNGLDMSKFPTMEEASIKHKLFKKKMLEFIQYYFFPYYSFDLENTLIFFLCGRYEFRDKGIDVFIKALAKLDEVLKKENSGKTIVAFFWVPGNVKAIKANLIENRTLFHDVRDSVDDELDDVRTRLITSFVARTEIKKETLLSQETLNELRVKTNKFLKKGIPPLSTHDLYNEDSDDIIRTCRQFGLTNTKENRVKVVYYSMYLTGADGLLDTSYYESMMGSHLGVFPSYYEPWGYTPLEAAALGIASVTTDLAGFGRYISKDVTQMKTPGIFVLKRYGVSEDKVADELAKTFHYYADLSKEDRIKNKLEAKHLAALADWKTFVVHYIEAHNIAADKVFRQ